MARQQALAPHARTAHTRVNPVRVWLFAVAALVFVMVSVGGATRLTGSGLSITEWKPIMGVIPPLSDAAWQEALEKYRQIPQYQHINKGMSLEAFKRIFWWEWSHRFLARFVGVAFLVPFLFFLAMGRIARPLIPKLAGLFALGGLQGAIGWYMVASGLSERISVSQYRLAVHLSLAIVIFAGLLWIAMSLGLIGTPGSSLLCASRQAVKSCHSGAPPSVVITWRTLGSCALMLRTCVMNSGPANSTGALQSSTMKATSGPASRQFTGAMTTPAFIAPSRSSK